MELQSITEYGGKKLYIVDVDIRSEEIFVLDRELGFYRWVSEAGRYQ